MTTLRRSLLLLPALASIALLAACATTTGSTDTGTDTGTDAGTSDGGDAETTGCDSWAGTENEPFTSPLVLSAPTEDALYGAGNSLVFELDASLAGEVPQIAFYDNFIGGAIRDTGTDVLIEDPENTFTAELGVYDSDLNNQVGIAQLFLISTTDYDGAQRSGDKVILGQYCVTYLVE